MIAKQSKSKSTRKTRTKLRKPKYLSLRLQLIANASPQPMSPTNNHDDQTQQLDLFPLHPENLVEQDKLDDEHNMACMFSSCDDVDEAATTLTGILCSEEQSDNVPSPSSVNYADEEMELVRTAMRKNNKDKVNDQEKWVCYSEVVDGKKMVREISSSSSSTTTGKTVSCCHYNNSNSNSNSHNNKDKHERHKLVLKLDYENIMRSWVNKGPYYVHDNLDVDAPQPQTVPELQDDHDFFLPSSINVAPHDEQDNRGNEGSWTVPQMAHVNNNGTSKDDDALQVGESSPMAHNREASVQRYKEKRRNRLFAKTVRYEVRKLNAEKRPRVKGRFVKSS